MLESNLTTYSLKWQTAILSVGVALMLSACGGGSDNSSSPASAPVTALPTAPAPLASASDPGAPALSGNVATDGLNWLNFRRSQAGVSVLPRSTLISRAAQSHSDYQKSNNIVSHDEISGKTGFTGVDLLARYKTAGYNLSTNGYAYGEVISATARNSGAYMAEELITAIYHRFVIFEPIFKEIGTGSAATASGYTYFTTDFAANNGYGTGLGNGKIITWPFDGQTKVAANFFSDYELPDPVSGQNEVGYPVSVHADISATLRVTSFTIRPRGGADLTVKLLAPGTDEETPISAAAIIPLTVLQGNTTYDVSFVGSANGVAIKRTWSFTTL